MEYDPREGNTAQFIEQRMTSGIAEDGRWGYSLPLTTHDGHAGCGFLAFTLKGAKWRSQTSTLHVPFIPIKSATVSQNWEIRVVRWQCLSRQPPAFSPSGSFSCLWLISPRNQLYFLLIFQRPYNTVDQKWEKVTFGGTKFASLCCKIKWNSEI